MSPANFTSPDGKHTAEEFRQDRGTHFRIGRRKTRSYDHIGSSVFTPDSRYLVYVAANEGGPARLLHDFYLVVVQLEYRYFFGVGIREKRFEIGIVGDIIAAVSPNSKYAMAMTREARTILSVNLDDEFCPTGERRRRAHARMASTSIADIEAMFRDFDKAFSEWEITDKDLQYCEERCEPVRKAWVNRTFDTPYSVVAKIAADLQTLEYSLDEARKARKAQYSKVKGLHRGIFKTILSHPRQDYQASHELLSIYDTAYAARRGLAGLLAALALYGFVVGFAIRDNYWMAVPILVLGIVMSAPLILRSDGWSVAFKRHPKSSSTAPIEVRDPKVDGSSPNTTCVAGQLALPNVRYHNPEWEFSLDLPNGWAEPGFRKRASSFFRYAKQSTQPEFYGPSGASLKIAIGPISPAPSVEEQQSNLRRIAAKYMHDVIEIGEITVGGKRHAAMLCRIPGVGIVKNYSLIFGGTEYLVTAQGNWSECDSIVGSFNRT